METRYLKCWEIPMIFTLSALMDPHVNLVSVELIINGISFNLNKLPTSDVRDLLTTMYNKYERFYSTNVGSSSSTLVSCFAAQSNANESPNGCKEKFNFSLLNKRSKGSSITISKLTKYLNTKFSGFFTGEEEANLDILNSRENFFRVIKNGTRCPHSFSVNSNIKICFQCW